MSHCHDEHAGHGHGHDHGYDHDHDHSDDITPVIQFSLYDQVNFDEITTLNESVRDAGKLIVKKTWAERMEVEPELESDADEQLLMTVPFTAQVKLHSILIRSSPSDDAPKTVHLHINRDDLDFSSAEDTKPQQTLELSQTTDVQEIPVRRALFGKVQRLVLFFPDNFGDDVTRISYIGFKGEWTQLGKAPTNIIYEAAAQPGDHKIKGTGVNDVGSGIGGGPRMTNLGNSHHETSSITTTTTNDPIHQRQVTMPPRLPLRVALPRPLMRQQQAAMPSSSPFLMLPRRSVHNGWVTEPPRSKHKRFNQPSSGLPSLTTGPAAALKRRENTTPLRTGVLATKKGMTAMYVGKQRIPCTVLQLDQVQVVANKTRESNGYWAVQIGRGSKDARNVSSPQLGYYEAKGVAPKAELAEFMVRDSAGLLPVGAQLQPDWFKVGQYVDVRGNSRGMGFAGGMKRHGFSGQEASHGNSKNHRTIGSVGPSQGSGSRVLPGKKMPGRMGNESVTVQNLKVMAVDNDLGTVLVSGPVPGPKGRTLKIQDSKKRKAPSLSHREKALDILRQRNPDLEERLLAARLAHIDLKKQRQPDLDL
ncbi:large subunit ribosomal protein L3 [Geosmithia morbida]|uniref:Large ribosomal subunit protein uL3m n=1 Tax=Geosmithia morbida TaxID=1094350 RepID=A0A9P4YXR4_9HYPO|nr:large subunit ribosomal protein L3 [Geosmithia morbida]KAF4123742.1 large subunit ribosomal protein L3 [Geosmithia morbida]